MNRRNRLPDAQMVGAFIFFVNFPVDSGVDGVHKYENVLLQYLSSCPPFSSKSQQENAWWVRE